MPMTEEHRSALQKAAGVSSAQLKQTLGPFDIPAANVKALGRPRAEITAAQNALMATTTGCTLIQARYANVARSAGAATDVRALVAQPEVSRDRKFLEEAFADEYRLTTPFGKTQGKKEVIASILAGTFSPKGLGSAGFESTESELRLHGTTEINTAVVSGTFVFKGSGAARPAAGGPVRRRTVSGTYRTTHTYILRDGRWQLASSHMTRLPAQPPPFVFVGEKG